MKNLLSASLILVLMIVISCTEQDSPINDADAIVFVVDCDVNAIAASRDKLIAMMGNATHVGLDWQSVVVVMQYNRAELYPQLKPDDLDQWLGIKEANVARFITSSHGGADLCVAVNEAARKVIAKLDPGQIRS